MSRWMSYGLIAMMIVGVMALQAWFYWPLIERVAGR